MKKVGLLLWCLFALASVTTEFAIAQQSGDEETWGGGIRLRNLIVPKAILEDFVYVVPSGMSRVEYGIDVTRRRKRYETTLSFSYARPGMDDGIWLAAKGDTPLLIEFDNFSWTTLDVSNVWRQPLVERLALRYGAGVGIGFTHGTIRETDYKCFNSVYVLDECQPKTDPKNDHSPVEDIPKVFPSYMVLGGLQYSPSSRIHLNLEAGLHMVFFVGVSTSVFL